jgi:hemerythrin
MAETDFPGRECHADEHAAVLRSMEAVRRRLAGGEVAPARNLARALADWLPPHVSHLDSALSHWMCKQRFGGKPVVLRSTRPGYASSLPTKTRPDPETVHVHP